MSTIAEETKQAVHAAGRTTAAPRRRPVTGPLDAAPMLRIVADDRTSRTTALLFQTVLFCAMCLSLLAVIQQAQSHSSDTPAVGGTGVNDNPPAVFVNAD